MSADWSCTLLVHDRTCCKIYCTFLRLCRAKYKLFKPRRWTVKNRFKLSTDLNLETLDTILSETNHVWAASQISDVGKIIFIQFEFVGNEKKIIRKDINLFCFSFWEIFWTSGESSNGIYHRVRFLGCTRGQTVRRYIPGVY